MPTLLPTLAEIYTQQHPRQANYEHVRMILSEHSWLTAQSQERQLLFPSLMLKPRLVGLLFLSHSCSPSSTQANSTQRMALFSKTILFLRNTLNMFRVHHSTVATSGNAKQQHSGWKISTIPVLCLLVVIQAMLYIAMLRTTELLVMVQPMTQLQSTSLSLMATGVGRVAGMAPGPFFFFFFFGFPALPLHASTLSAPEKS